LYTVSGTVTWARAAQEWWVLYPGAAAAKKIEEWPLVPAGLGKYLLVAAQKNIKGWIRIVIVTRDARWRQRFVHE
jgi:hypothetical protein